MIKCNTGNLIQKAVKAFLFSISYILSNQGNRNASDGIALAQTVEAGMDEISGMLQKIRTLAVQANNGTNTLDDRKALAKEASSLATVITRIAKQTTFAGKTILNGKQTNSIDPFVQGAGGAGGGNKGDAMSITLQVGSNKGDTISFGLVNLQFSAAAVAGGVDAGQFDGAASDTKAFVKDAQNGDFINVNFSTAGMAANIINMMDQMIGYVDGQRADLGAIQNHESLRKQPLKSLKVA